MGVPDKPGGLTAIQQYNLEVKLDIILEDLRASCIAAAIKHAPMNTPHEGHSVIEEEYEELWEHVRADTGRSRKEALQLAAMGIRYVLDLCD